MGNLRFQQLQVFLKTVNLFCKLGHEFRNFDLVKIRRKKQQLWAFSYSQINPPRVNSPRCHHYRLFAWAMAPLPVVAPY